MDVVQVLLACSLYFDDDLVRAIVQSTSRNNPHFIYDSSADLSDPSPVARTVSSATSQTQSILERDGRPVLGLMAVPISWLDYFGRKASDAFDPCINVSVGTAKLAEFAYECAGRMATNRPTPSIRACVLRKYEDENAMTDFAHVVTLELRIEGPLSIPLRNADSPIFSASQRANWGASKLLLGAP